MTDKRRARLANKVAIEKQLNATGTTQADLEALAKQVTITLSKYFMIEPQVEGDGDEEGEEVYAVYRLTDLLTNSFADGAGVDPIGPVHVFTSIVDAVTAVGFLDKLVDAIEKDDAVSVTVPEVAQPAVQ